jgi:hypothetical protein
MNSYEKTLRMLQYSAALILAWAGLTKFAATEGNVFIFAALGMEPFGRILIGVIEVCAAMMLTGVRFAALGALLGFGTMCGAVIAHVSILGPTVRGDQGLHLVLLACVSCATAVVLVARRRSLPLIGPTL